MTAPLFRPQACFHLHRQSTRLSTHTLLGILPSLQHVHSGVRLLHRSIAVSLHCCIVACRATCNPTDGGMGNGGHQGRNLTPRHPRHPRHPSTSPMQQHEPRAMANWVLPCKRGGKARAWDFIAHGRAANQSSSRIQATDSRLQACRRPSETIDDGPFRAVFSTPHPPPNSLFRLAVDGNGECAGGILSSCMHPIIYESLGRIAPCMHTPFPMQVDT